LKVGASFAGVAFKADGRRPLTRKWRFRQQPQEIRWLETRALFFVCRRVDICRRRDIPRGRGKKKKTRGKKKGKKKSGIARSISTTPLVQPAGRTTPGDGFRFFLILFRASGAAARSGDRRCEVEWSARRGAAGGGASQDHREAASEKLLDPDPFRAFFRKEIQRSHPSSFSRTPTDFSGRWGRREITSASSR